eukprot:459232-Hanusia_phi.AAC.2
MMGRAAADRNRGRDPMIIGFRESDRIGPSGPGKPVSLGGRGPGRGPPSPASEYGPQSRRSESRTRSSACRVRPRRRHDLMIPYGQWPGRFWGQLRRGNPP